MAGRGLFTRDFIAKNQWICEYGGELQHASSFPGGFPQSAKGNTHTRGGGRRQVRRVLLDALQQIHRLAQHHPRALDPPDVVQQPALYPREQARRSAGSVRVRRLLPSHPSHGETGGRGESRPRVL